MQLLTRTPVPHPNESPRGYVIRLTEENGYSSQSAILSLVGERDSTYVVTVGWNFEKLRAILGKRSALAFPKDFGYRVRGSGVRQTARLSGHRLHARHLGLLKARVCPECVGELGYIPSAWDLKAFVACPFHGRMLLKQCSVCGARIKYERARLSSCRCGHSFADMESESAPPELLGLMEVLWAKTYGDEGALCVARAIGLPVEELLNMDLDLICRTVVTLASVVIEMEDATRQPRSNAKVVSRISYVARALSSWPRRFQVFCWHYMRRTELPKRMGYGVFQIDFSWLYVRLYKNLKSRKKQTLFLAKEGLVFGLQVWDGHPIRLRDPILQRLPLPPRRYGSFRDAAERLKIPEYTAVRWIAKGKIPAISLGTKKMRPLWQVDLWALDRMRISRQPSIGQRTAAKRMGVPHSVYRLVKKKVMKKGMSIRGWGGVTSEEIDEFVGRVVQRATVPVAPEATTQVGAFLDRALAPSVKAGLIESILRGEVPVYGDGSEIRALWFDANLIQGAVSAAEKAKRFTAHQATHRFQIRAGEAKAIFDSLSRSRTHGSGGAVTSEEIAAFLREYVPLREIAQRAGVLSTSLRRVVTAAKLLEAIVRMPAGSASPINTNTSALFVPRPYVPRVAGLARRLGKHGR